MFDVPAAASTLGNSGQFDIYNQAKAQAKVATGTDSEMAIIRIAQQIEQLQNTARRLETVADRIHGSRPKDVGGMGATAPGNPPLSTKLSMLGDLLQRLQADLQDSADRLESFV